MFDEFLSLGSLSKIKFASVDSGLPMLSAWKLLLNFNQWGDSHFEMKVIFSHKYLLFSNNAVFFLSLGKTEALPTSKCKIVIYCLNFAIITKSALVS